MRCNNIIKDGRRYRYIGFVIKSSTAKVCITKKEMIRKIRTKCRQIFDKECKEMGIYLTRFNGKKGIVRCSHLEKDHTIKLLKSINQISSQKIDIETVGTSGTIKSLIKKHMSN